MTRETAFVQAFNAGRGAGDDGDEPAIFSKRESAAGL
jgi:hypothetical protein